MSELKKPTIEGLVEKISENEYVNSEDIIAVEGLLRQAAGGMSNEEIFKLISTLNDRLDSTTGDLITQNGLNFAVFETAVHETTNIIIRDKEAKIQEENEKAQQGEKTEEQLLAEKEKQEKEERIEENKNYLDNLLSEFPEEIRKEFSPEIVEEFATEIERIEAFNKKYNEYKKTLPPKEAKEKAMKECGIKEEELQSEKTQAVKTISLKRSLESICENCKTAEERREAIEKFAEDNEYMMEGANAGLIASLINTGKVLPEIVIGAFRTFKENRNQKKEDKREEKEDKANADIRAVTYADKLDIEKLLKNITAKEITDIRNRNERKKILKKESRRSKKSEEEKKFESFYDDITKKYLEENKTISEIYEELRDTDFAKQEELEFEDFLDAINDRLMAGANGNPVQEHDVKILMIIERKTRRIDMFYDRVEMAKENGATIEAHQNELLDKIDSTDRKSRKDAYDLRKKCALRVGINSKENISTERTKIKRKEEKKDKKQKLEDDIVRMSNDKNEIIKISKENGITTDEAAKIYFSKNEDAFKAYSLKERRILIGKDKLNKNIIEPSKTLKKIRAFTRKRYDGLIETYNTDIKRITGEIAELEKDFDNPKELNYKIKELENAKKKLKKIEEKNKKLERQSKPKNAIDTIDRKLAKKEEKRIFTMYLESGKSAVDIYDEILASGNEFGFDQDDMIRIVKEGARKYLQVGHELHSLVENEKVLFDYKRSLNSLQIRRENAEQKDLSDWISSYDEQIAVIKSNQKVAQYFNNKYRDKIFRRMGKKPPINTLPKDEQGKIEVSEIVTMSDIKEPQNTEQSIIQRDQTNSIKNGESNKSQGLIPNIKAIVKKAKVTNSKVKNAVSQIVGLGKKEKGINQEDKQFEEQSKDENKTQNTEETR